MRCPREPLPQDLSPLPFDAHRTVPLWWPPKCPSKEQAHRAPWVMGLSPGGRTFSRTEGPGRRVGSAAEFFTETQRGGVKG